MWDGMGMEWIFERGLNYSNLGNSRVKGALVRIFIMAINAGEHFKFVFGVGLLELISV